MSTVGLRRPGTRRVAAGRAALRRARARAAGRRAAGLPAGPNGACRRRRVSSRTGSGLAVVHTCPACGRGLDRAVSARAPASALAPRPCAVRRARRRRAARAGAIVAVGAALVVLWLLNLEDVLLTRRALALGAIEANAVMGFFLRFGFVPAALIKMADRDGRVDLSVDPAPPPHRAAGERRARRASTWRSSSTRSSELAG